MEYVNLPVEVEPDALEQRAYDYLSERIDGWQPAPGNLDTWLIEAFAQIAADVASTASDVPVAIFREFGAKLAGVPPLEAAPASGTTTWTLSTDNGLTIPEGATIGVDGPDGLVAFQTTEQRILSPGTMTVAAVPVVAVIPGASGSGLSGDAVLLDALDGVSAVALDGPTTGGQDAETDEVYLPRLVEELSLLSPRAITGNDAAAIVKRVPGIARATTLDGYNPADGTFNNPGYVAVVAVDSDGGNITEAAKAAARSLVTADDARLLNLVVNVIDPTRTPIAVDFTVAVWPDYAEDAVVKNAKDAVASYLSPANWGQPNYGDRRAWVNSPVVRYLEVAQVLNEVPGVNYVASLKLNNDTADVTLPGAAPMPGTATVTGAAV